MKLGQKCFRDANRQALSYLYFEEEQGGGRRGTIPALDSLDVVPLLPGVPPMTHKRGPFDNLVIPVTFLGPRNA